MSHNRKSHQRWPNLFSSVIKTIISHTIEQMYGSSHQQKGECLYTLTLSSGMAHSGFEVIKTINKNNYD